VLHPVANDAGRKLFQRRSIFLLAQCREHFCILSIEKAAGLFDADEVAQNVGFQGPELPGTGFAPRRRRRQLRRPRFIVRNRNSRGDTQGRPELFAQHAIVLQAPDQLVGPAQVTHLAHRDHQNLMAHKSKIVFQRLLAVRDVVRVLQRVTRIQILKGDSVFKGQLVVLVDSRSASAAEIFARLIQLEHRGTVLGDRSAGAVMEARHFPHQSGLDVVDRVLQETQSNFTCVCKR